MIYYLLGVLTGIGIALIQISLTKQEVLKKTKEFFTKKFTNTEALIVDPSDPLDAIDLS